MTNGNTMFVAALLAAGCGKVGPSVSDAGPADAATDTGTIDAAPPCDLAKNFGPPTEVPGLRVPGAADEHATLTDDELTVYFGSDREPSDTVMHIYSSTRGSRDVGFPMPGMVGALYSAAGESNPSVVPDGNTIFFDSGRTSAGAGPIHIFTSTRANASVVFPTPALIAGDYLIGPSITSNNNTLYAGSLQSGRLERLERTASGFGMPQQVDLPSQFTVRSPVTRDDLTLYVSQGGGNSGGKDLMVSKRASVTAPWPAPTRIAELSVSDGLAAPSWVSPDGCRVYLTYSVAGGTTAIFVASRPQ